MPVECVVVIKGFSDVVKQYATPILVANATVLVMVSVRSWQMADRARDNVDEYLYKVSHLTVSENDITDRKYCLIEQNRSFLIRYKMVSFSFIMLFMAMMFFGASIFVFGDSIQLSLISSVCAYIALALAFLGSGIMFIESYFFGYYTLSQNNRALDYRTMAGAGRVDGQE